MAYQLYQPKSANERTDAQRDARLRLTMCLNEDNAMPRVWAAHALYEHTANVHVNTPDQVFEVTNVGPEQYIERLGQMASGSVGDVLLRGTEGWVCLSFGWLEMSAAQVETFRCFMASRETLERLEVLTL